jgi:hypothetical protein
MLDGPYAQVKLIRVVYRKGRKCRSCNSLGGNVEIVGIAGLQTPCCVFDGASGKLARRSTAILIGYFGRRVIRARVSTC